MSGDTLGDRMKDYESVPRTRLVRRTPVLIRLDGKAFHTFTRGMDRPWDKGFSWAMWQAARFLCEQVQGCQLAYVQSDEISLLLVDYQRHETQAWFDYEVQKMTSVAASLCTVGFMRALDPAKAAEGIPAFDARAWNLPRHEVVNYFIWRQNDATRNSILALGQAHFSHKQLHGKKCPEIRAMLRRIGAAWEDVPAAFARGVSVTRHAVADEDGGHARKRWLVDAVIPVFADEREYVQRFVDVEELREEVPRVA